MSEDVEIYPCDIEWYDLVKDTIIKGGKLWVLQRTDTKQFFIRDRSFQLMSSHEFNLIDYSDSNNWRQVFPNFEGGNRMHLFDFEDLYPSKDLADKFAPKKVTEGGCKYCGHGSKEIPVKIIECIVK